MAVDRTRLRCLVLFLSVWMLLPLAARAEDLAREISGNARNSVRAAKRVSDLIAAGTLAETPESRGLYDASFESPEFAEGTRAFIEKRPPKF